MNKYLRNRRVSRLVGSSAASDSEAPLRPPQRYPRLRGIGYQMARRLQSLAKMQGSLTPLQWTVHSERT